MKVTTALLVGTLAAGAAADRAERHARHLRLHEKRNPQPSEEAIMHAIRSEHTLGKRCGEMINAGQWGSFPMCWDNCASDPACNGGSAPAAAPAPAPAPAAPAPAPAAPAAPAQKSPAASSPSPDAQAKNQNNVNKQGSSSSAPASSASKGGKKGLGYTAASAVGNSWPGISWAYNWAATSGGLASGVQFIPMMHDLGSVDGFASTVAGLDKSTPLLSFNEPDREPGVGGSQIDPNTAAAKHKATMGPLQKAGHPIVSPAVSSSTDPGNGLSWLSSFGSACGKDCPIDACGVHWYGPMDKSSAAAQAKLFQDFIGQAASTCNKFWPGKKLWVTEFAALGPQSDFNQAIRDVTTNAAFLAIVVPWLDSQSSVERYAPFAAGPNELLQAANQAGQALIHG